MRVQNGSRTDLYFHNSRRAYPAASNPKPNATATGGGRRVRSKKRAGLLAALTFVIGIGMLLAPVQQAAADPPPIAIMVSFGPPALPYYSQPMCPGPGYLWTPGYWAWDPSYGYYWVPGTWVPAPYEGALWTPGYWGWSPVYASFVWYPGYWGPAVGFYGGINYGYGYPGQGYYGGYWRGRDFYYNRDVDNVNVVNVTNVYNQTVIVNNNSQISYNGGQGGIIARPTNQQLAAGRERRFGPVAQQVEQERSARGDPNQRASINHGRPEIAATPRPGMFRGQGVMRATRAGGFYHEPPVQRGNMHPAPQGRRGWHSFNQPTRGLAQRSPQMQQARRREGQAVQQPTQYRPFRGNAPKAQPNRPQQRPTYRQYNGNGQQQKPRPTFQQRQPQQRPQQTQSQNRGRGGQQKPQRSNKGGGKPHKP